MENQAAWQDRFTICFFPNSRLGKTYLEEGCTGEGGISGRLDAAVNFERAMSQTRTGQKVIIIIITNE